MSAAARRTLRELERLSACGLDSLAFRHAALRQLRRAMPVDAAWFATADPTTLLFTSAVVDDVLRPHAPHFLYNEFLGDDVNQFRGLVRPGAIASTLDLETEGRRERSARYRDILEPLALGDELRVALVEGGRCWGFLCLHRARGAGFTPGEVGFLRRAARHLAVGLRTGLLLESAAAGPGLDAPGLLVLAPDLSLVSANPAAELLLAEVGDEYWTGQAELPGAVYGVVGGLLAGSRDDMRAPPPRARMRTATGRWLTLHASWLGAGAGGERQIAVVLEASPPVEVWPLVTAGHQLSPRESDVTLLVARGLSTSEIGRSLRISEHTVQDHLKAVFDKFGVHSRGQLLAAVFGGHYLPLMEGQPSPGGSSSVVRP
jgi:DNA-binding CsgD family transcriptional regulator